MATRAKQSQQTQSSYNSIIFTDIELKYDLVLADM